MLWAFRILHACLFHHYKNNKNIQYGKNRPSETSTREFVDVRATEERGWLGTKPEKGKVRKGEEEDGLRAQM